MDGNQADNFYIVLSGECVHFQKKRELQIE
jgi:hypothetical protein